jgi:hypothetical protein
MREDKNFGQIWSEMLRFTQIGGKWKGGRGHMGRWKKLEEAGRGGKR